MRSGKSSEFRGGLGAIILLVCVLLVAVGCQPDPDAAIAEKDGTGPTEEQQLLIYSGRSESLVQPLIDRFAEQSGLDVKVRYGDTAELAATIFEEGGNSPADLFYAQDPGGLGVLADAGLLTVLPDELLDTVPALFAAADGKWIGVSGRARTIVYNTEALSPDDLPNDLWGFTDPKWSGRIGWAPSNGSFQAMVTGMRSLWGEERTAEWLTAIQANKPLEYPKNTPIVAAAGSGEIEVGFVNHYYLHRFLDEFGDEFGARNHYLTARGPGSLLLVSGVGILETASNSAGAIEFINFLLSEDAQTYFVETTFEFPVIEGIESAQSIVPEADLSELLLALEPSKLTDLAGTAALLSELGILP